MLYRNLVFHIVLIVYNVLSGCDTWSYLNILEKFRLVSHAQSRTPGYSGFAFNIFQLRDEKCMLFVAWTEHVKKSYVWYFFSCSEVGRNVLVYPECQQSSCTLSSTTHCTVLLQHLLLLLRFSLICATVKFNRMGPHSNHRFLVEERRLQSSDY